RIFTKQGCEPIRPSFEGGYITETLTVERQCICQQPVSAAHHVSVFCYQTIKQIINIFVVLNFVSEEYHLLINDKSAIMARREELEDLKNYGFDAAFAEQIDFCGIGVIRYIGIKNLLWISTTPIMDAVSYNLGIPAPPSYVPTIEENDNNDIMTFWQRAFNIYMYIGAIFIHRWSTNMMTEVTFRNVDPNFPNIREIAANASLCFVNIDEMFDLPRPIIQKNVYIGGLGVQKPKPLDQKFSTLMEKGEKGVIIVSLGTIAPFHAFKQVTKVAFANVFKSMLDYHFILKIEKASLEVTECTSGLYNDSQWPAGVSSQCCYPPRQVWYQFADPGGMEGLVGHGRRTHNRKEL
uniref:glucuronosyltransferase n=1 Tax=Angiostrongylus cantonensis TaxID=6313 RepID=A0A0K0DQ34_ANGCA